MNIVVLGMNHRTAPLIIRERFAVSEPQILLTELLQAEEINEAVLLSTCNRVEVIAASNNAESSLARLQRFFVEKLGHGDGAPLRTEEVFYALKNREAIQHLFRVAASIDSMVVGEPQILGQVKESYRQAANMSATGTILSRLYDFAFSAAKRVRTETSIAAGALSVAGVGVDLAKRIFERFDDKKILLIGAGDMIELACDSLTRIGNLQVRVANRTRGNAEELAARFAGSAHGLEELDELLIDSDLVFASIACQQPILRKKQFQRALSQRTQRPMFVIDLGVPRNIDPDANELDDIYLYDLDDLQGVATEHASQRETELSDAERIVSEETERFENWLGSRSMSPTIQQLREHAEQIRSQEFVATMRKMQLSDTEYEKIEALTRSIVNKLLHPTWSRLREDDSEGYVSLVRTLFGLEETEVISEKHEKEDQT